MTWLGYKISGSSDQLKIGIGDLCWLKLEYAFILAHKRSESPRVALDVAHGWIAQQGACWEHERRKEVVARLLAIGDKEYFTELPSANELLNVWDEAHDRWTRLRDQVDTTVDPVGEPASASFPDGMPLLDADGPPF